MDIFNVMQIKEKKRIMELSLKEKIILFAIIKLKD